MFLAQHGAAMLDRAIHACFERHGSRPDFVILPEGWMNVFGTTDVETNDHLRPLSQVAARVSLSALLLLSRDRFLSAS